MKAPLLLTAFLVPLLVGCGATAPQPTTPTPSPSPVLVPAVSSTVRSTLLLEDPHLVFKQNEQLPLAPDTFAVLENGDIILDDFLTDQFAIYHSGKRITEFDEPVAVVDMAIGDKQVYLLDTNYTVTVYNPTAKGLKEVRAIALPPIKLGKQSEYSALYFEGPNLIADTDFKVLVEGPGPVLPEPTQEAVGQAIHFTDGNTNAIVPVSYGPYLVRRLALTDQHVFYKVEDWDGEGRERMRDFIVQFDLNGNLVHTYAVYRIGSTAQGRKFVVANGNLYQMWISEKTVKVYQLLPNDGQA